LAYFGDLAALAASLRSEGLDVRNLGQIGITVWTASEGFYFPAAELEDNAELVARRDFQAILSRRNGARRTDFSLSSRR